MLVLALELDLIVIALPGRVKHQRHQPPPTASEMVVPSARAIQP